MNLLLAKNKESSEKGNGVSIQKGSSRPLKYATRRIQIVKLLFWTEPLNLITKDELIINIDESSFDCSVKVNIHGWN